MREIKTLYRVQDTVSPDMARKPTTIRQAPGGWVITTVSREAHNQSLDAARKVLAEQKASARSK